MSFNNIETRSLEVRRNQILLGYYVNLNTRTFTSKKTYSKDNIYAGIIRFTFELSRSRDVRM